MTQTIKQNIILLYFYETKKLMCDIMKFLKDLWHKIVSSNDEQYINKIAELEIIIKKQKEDYNNLSSDYNVVLDNYYIMKKQFDEIQDLKNFMLKELEQYKNPTTPDEINSYDIEIKSNDYPYLPSWLIFYYKNGLQTKSITVTPTKFYKIWSDEMYKDFNNQIKNCKTFDEKVIKIRDYILSRTKYEHDAGKVNKAENWRMPTETYYGKVGDCDDFAILWISACKMCGLPADRVFLATGYVKWLGKEYGHAWNIAKFDDDKWYAVDSTSSKVVKLLGSDFKIKGFLRGISNWKFSGVPKNEQF